MRLTAGNPSDRIALNTGGTGLQYPDDTHGTNTSPWDQIVWEQQ